MRRSGARSHRRGLGLGSGPSLFSLIIALAATRPVFTADYYAIDGVSGKVASFIDWNDPTHTLAQATSANQVALPAAHADFANKLCATFAGAQWYASNRAAALWGFPISPTGGSEVVATLTRTGTGQQYVYGTRNATNGISLVTQTVGSVQWLGIAVGIGFNNTIAAGLVTDTPTYLRANCFEGASPEVELYFKGSSVLSTTTNITEPTNLADGPLNLGRRLDNSSFLIGRWRDLMFFPKLAAGGIATLAQYELAQGIS